MSSTADLDASRYLQAIKEMLKERGVTYSRLADALGCSLPTIKRSLNKPSLPLSRLLETCEVAGIPFEELHQRAEAHRPTHFVFTDEQDRLFAEREEFLWYFLELASDGRTPFEIAERHGLDQRSTKRYLEKLAAVGLIELSGGTRVTLVAEPPFGFGPASRVLRAQQQDFMHSVVERVLAADPSDRECVAVLKPIALAREDYDRMVDEMVQVVHRFAAVAERGVGRGPIRPWRVALAAGPAPDAVTHSIPRVT